MAYTDANTVQDPASGERILSAWGDQIRTNQEDHETRLLGVESSKVDEDDSGWQLPTLESGVTVNANYSHLGYRRLNGWIMLQIAVDIASPSVGFTLFTLPAGFRPTQEKAQMIDYRASAAFLWQDDGRIRLFSSVSTLRANAAMIL